MVCLAILTTSSHLIQVGVAVLVVVLIPVPQHILEVTVAISLDEWLLELHLTKHSKFPEVLFLHLLVHATEFAVDMLLT